ncbi:flagellar biosynthesis protein FlhF [Alteromonas sp.]|uniref:flagellar biosynthesis protein FlhF n=1 Tax=Alteromonas sp. TaxID=232 RepID=UPI000B72BD71|nr:flagellar biosynthesis protein FlhF [Alteromonas sp.]MAI38453.1 flagellar biosynthesis protein FlhF [Alteromonas sp.]OUX85734.1 MAG: flagellar biosynthesis protein FlhF [Alteromonas sp. TMED35]|tara:strand:+ start:174461 stop:175888 length:1428 start_codon:yes stop_codon:yes gene_type:complete
MKIRRYFGKDMREALSQVKAELGSDAVIMSNRKVADGIELVAAYDKEPEAKLNISKPSGAPSSQTFSKQNATPSLSEIIGDDGPDSLKALLEKQHGAGQGASAEVMQPTSVNVQHANDIASHLNFSDAFIDEVEAQQPIDRHSGPSEYQRQSEAFPSHQASSIEEAPAAPSDELAQIKEELASLRGVLQHQVADLMEAKQTRQKPVHQYLITRLTDMGLSKALSKQLISYTPSHYNERDAWVYLLNLLANRLNVTGNDILIAQGAVALVGPTGTGKTTTVAKLAARYAQKYGADSVAMITIDTYRIAAYEQLATYGKIIGCTVRKAQSSEELSDLLFQLRHKRLVLIDTAGFSQRDSRLIKQIKHFDNGQMPVVKKYLVAQANTQYPALQRIIRAYDDIELSGCIFTKLDECYSLGEVLSAAVEYQLPVSYVTDGQKVPEDIKIAEAKSLVSAAAKLYKKYGLDHTSNNNDIKTA